MRLFAGRQFERIEGDLLAEPLQIVGKIDAGGPKDLPHILEERQFVRLVRRDPADPPAEREGHLDHVVESRRIPLGAERADIFVAIDGLERGARVEHSAAARAQHIPRQFENAEPRGMQKGRDDTLVIESLPCREIDQVDAAQLAVRGLGYKTLDRRHRFGVDRLPQDRE